MHILEFLRLTFVIARYFGVLLPIYNFCLIESVLVLDQIVENTTNIFFNILRIMTLNQLLTLKILFSTFNDYDFKQTFMSQSIIFLKNS